jgi:hypothetical protein
MKFNVTWIKESMLIRLTPTDTTCSIQIVGSETRFIQEIK